jgi:hypothetical protein
MNPESELLKKWKLDATPPSNFNSIVWRRIEERRGVSVADAMRHWVSELFARRAVAVAYLSLAFVFGLGAAHIQSSRVLRERDSQLEARYVQSIDPYAPPVSK